MTSFIEKPSAVTIGHRASRRSSCPTSACPNEFAIVRPGNRGYLLTLAEPHARHDLR